MTEVNAPRTPRLTRVQVAGIICTVLAAVGYWMPHVVFAGSVSQVRSLCSSPAGALAQGLSEQAVAGCSDASIATGLLAMLGIAGLLMLIVPALANVRGAR
jgi:hypothetical protein